MSKKVYPKSTKWEDTRLLKHKPLYTVGSRDAHRYGESDLWFQSYQENCACARAIEKTIKDGYAERRLNEDCVKDIVEKFGVDRVSWVLANTTQQSPEKVRYGCGNVEWAGGFCIPEDKWWNERFTVCAHPGLVEIFTNHVRRAWESLKLFGAEQCYKKSEWMDYTGKIAAVKPELLKDEYKSSGHQLFYVRGEDGEKVYGRFLCDGEEMSFRRLELLGVVRLGLIPEWAQEKYAEAAGCCNEEEETITSGMGGSI